MPRCLDLEITLKLKLYRITLYKFHITANIDEYCLSINRKKLLHIVH